MDSFAPEFSRFWLPPRDAEDPVPGERTRADDEARSQQAALEDLAGRVSAARTIV
jgi:hypothetical protein